MTKRSHHLVLGLALAVTAGAAQAAISTFLLVPGVPGESTDDRHPNWIDVQSVSVGVADRACTAFVVTKHLDKSSPLLSGSAMTGGSYPTMTVEVVKDGESRVAFLTYSLIDVTVSSVNVSSSSAVPVVETVHLMPAKITMSYRPQRADGNYDDPVSFPLTCLKK